MKVGAADASAPMVGPNALVSPAFTGNTRKSMLSHAGSPWRRNGSGCLISVRIAEAEGLLTVTPSGAGVVGVENENSGSLESGKSRS